ncbi:MAG TPA: hypothetical protein VEQ58_00825 [Polyangiaceae bacterium]|nr:hypothetical protein [Polyangiaceae bacterium]
MPVSPAPVAKPTPTAEQQRLGKLSRYWLANDADWESLRVDLAGLRKSDLFATMIPIVLRMLAESARGSEAQRSCLRALVEHTDEVWLHSTHETGVALLSFDSAGLQAARSACLGAVIPPERVKVAGADEAYAIEGQEVVVLPNDVVLVGTLAQVEAALSPTAKPTPLPAHFALAPDQQLGLHFEIEEQKTAFDSALSVSGQRLLLTSIVHFPEEALAAELEKNFQTTKAEATAMLASGQLDQELHIQSGRASVQRLLDAVTLERDHQVCKVRLDLVGDPAQQAHDIGTMAAVGIASTRRYMAEAKIAEARLTLVEIAKAYNPSASEAAPNQTLRPRKLASLPAVPSAVPHGTKYQSSAADWKPWASIHFAITEPQYFQYEVVAAKDGKSADLIARGDIDGDGELSEFRLKLVVEKDGRLMAKPLEEKQPLE